MKKSIIIGVTSMFFVVMVLVALQHPVSAMGLGPNNGVAAGSWTTGTDAPLNLAGTTYPDYLQLMDENGTVIASPGQICHPFRGGNYGWTADIRQLIGGTWQKLATTMAWVPDKDGEYMACALAPAAGTYALFGYYDPAKAPVSSAAAEEARICDYANWDAHIWYHDDSYEWEPGWSFEVTMGSNVEEFPLGQTVTYTIVGTYPVTGLTIAQTGTTTSWDDGEIYATFTDNSIDWSEFSTQVLIETGQCSQVLDWNSDPENIWGPF
jgi:hypothetical protein